MSEKGQGILGLVIAGGALLGGVVSIPAVIIASLGNEYNETTAGDTDNKLIVSTVFTSEERELDVADINVMGKDVAIVQIPWFNKITEYHCFLKPNAQGSLELFLLPPDYKANTPYFSQYSVDGPFTQVTDPEAIDFLLERIIANCTRGNHSNLHVTRLDEGNGQLIPFYRVDTEDYERANDHLLTMATAAREENRKNLEKTSSDDQTLGDKVIEGGLNIIKRKLEREGR